MATKGSRGSAEATKVENTDMRLLLDTNAVIDHLNGVGSEVPPFGREYTMSVMSEAELLRYGGLSENEERRIDMFLGRIRIIPVSSKIARRAALLGRVRKTALIDLLIAATALEEDAYLVTRNQKDFRRIPGLNLRDHF